MMKCRDLCHTQKSIHTGQQNFFMLRMIKYHCNGCNSRARHNSKHIMVKERLRVTNNVWGCRL
uniref:Uncharacterized protein n=1 Tax=Arundo donax TaxID=35708 RepID=A0A0A9CSH0_ARUDO